MMNEEKNIHHSSFYPDDGEYVIYYFRPFEKWYTGVFDKETLSVSGKHGFTTWHTEVTHWMSGEDFE